MEIDPAPHTPPDDDIAWLWHDNPIYGMRFVVAEPERQDWTSDLVLDIDFISEWLCEPAGEFRFRVAPATLTFRDVSDLRIAIDHGDSGGRTALSEWSIANVARERLDRPFVYWRWTITLSVPPGGTISFCSSGYAQTLRAEPRLVAEQRLPRAERQL